ncbi:MAG: hypothetical protein IJ404_03170 [Clostridia bacterium]|nr:hypothetical protein [Clostridia bacterium]
MIFTDTEDFFAQAEAAKLPTREEEKSLAKRMSDGDESAKEALIKGYLPLAASYVRRAPKEIRSLHTVYACIAELEAGVDSFNFLQDSETFTHHLSWRLRQCIARCLTKKL